MAMLVSSVVCQQIRIFATDHPERVASCARLELTSVGRCTHPQQLVAMAVAHATLNLSKQNFRNPPRSELNRTTFEILL